MELSGKHQGEPKGTAPDAGAAWAALLLPLQECGEIAMPRLSGALSDSLRLASDQLFTLSTHARTPLERDALLDASGFAEKRRQGLVDDFRKHFEQRYVLACRREPLSAGGRGVIGMAQMRIVEHDRLEDVLDPRQLTEAIQNANWTALSDLAKRFRVWLELPGLMPYDLPIGPRLIGETVSDALRDQFWRNEAKQQLLLLLDRYLPDRVGTLYRDLAQHLNADVQAPSHVPVAIPESIQAPFETSLEAPALPTRVVSGDAVAVPSVDRVVDEPETAPRIEPTLPDLPFEPPTAVAALAPLPPVALHPADEGVAAARDEVARRLAGKSLPAFIADFLNGPWQARLAQLHAELGAGSPAWVDALDCMEALIQTVTGTAPQGDGLGQGLPALMQRLRLGLEALGAPLESRNRFFINLAQCHAQTVASSRVRAPAPRPESCPVAAATSGVAASQAKVTAPLAAASAPFLTSPAQLETGDWMVLLEPDGATRELKLAWISAQRSLFLWTDHQGTRARPLGVEELSTLMREGQARIVRPPAADKANTKKKAPGGPDAAPRYQKTA